MSRLTSAMLVIPHILTSVSPFWSISSVLSHSLSYTPLNSAMSSCGFTASISTVPIRSASAWLLASTFISSVSDTPLSDTSTFPAALICGVTISQSFFVVSRLTSNVLRLRLFIPIIFTSSASILFISSSSCTSHSTSSPRL